MILPGEEIPLDESTREDLGRQISLYIDDMENENRTYFGDIATYWKWYEGTPLVKGQKNFPFVNASNIVVPLSKIMVDADVNRMYAHIFRSSKNIWTLETEREDLQRSVKDLSRFLNWAANNNEFNFRVPAYDQLLESRVVGVGVMALNWREDVRWAYAPNRGRKSVKAVRVRHRTGAFPEHVPREQMMWDTNFEIEEAPFVCREMHKSWTELRNMAELDDSWHRESIEEIRGRGELRGPSQIVQRERDAADSRSKSFIGTTDVHDIRECHLDWPLIGAMGFDDNRVSRPGREKIDQPSPPIVATIDRNTNKLLRLIAEPYFFPDKPFYAIYYRKRAGRGHSVGIPKIVEGMQRGMSASLNQAIDARTRANAVWAITTDKTLASRPLNPASPLVVANMKDFAPLDFPTATFDDQRMLTVINTIAERLTGQSDPAMGRDTRQGGHPSPARSTIALMQQSDLLQGTSKELLRLQYSRLGGDILSLYQQFETDKEGKIFRAMGQKDGERISTFLFPEDPISASMTFDVQALSNNNNPQEEMQRALFVSQMVQTYWMSVVKAVSLLENPQVGEITRKAIIEGIKANTQSHIRFLESGDVDDIERYVLSLADDAQAGPEDLARASQRAQEIAKAGAGAQNPGVGGGVGGALGGAAGAPRAGGGIGGQLAA